MEQGQYQEIIDVSEAFMLSSKCLEARVNILKVIFEGIMLNLKRSSSKSLYKQQNVQQMIYALNEIIKKDYSFAQILDDNKKIDDFQMHLAPL